MSIPYTCPYVRFMFTWIFVFRFSKLTGSLLYWLSTVLCVLTWHPSVEFLKTCFAHTTQVSVLHECDVLFSYNLSIVLFNIYRYGRTKFYSYSVAAYCYWYTREASLSSNQHPWCFFAKNEVSCKFNALLMSNRKPFCIIYALIFYQWT